MNQHSLAEITAALASLGLKLGDNSVFDLLIGPGGQYPVTSILEEGSNKYVGFLFPAVINR